MKYLVCMFCHAWASEDGTTLTTAIVSNYLSANSKFVFDESGSYCSTCLWDEDTRIADADHIAEVTVWRGNERT